MRLAELDPRWLTLTENGQTVGLSFECPHCREQRLAVFFHEKGKELVTDAYIKANSPNTQHIWEKLGTSFEDLTLFPSVDASKDGHWHGWVKRGLIV